MILIFSLIFLSVNFSHSSSLIRDDRIVFRDSNEELSYGVSRLGVNETKQDDQREIHDDPDADIGSEFSQGFFQGDIALTEEQQEYFNSTQEEDENELFRTGLTDKRFRWPKNSEGKVVVPYEIATDSEYSNNEKRMIRLAMRDIAKYTCVRFIRRTNEHDYIEIKSGSACYAYLGRVGGKQHVSLTKKYCFLIGTVIHELIHALGYDHMHNHAQRDQFITIQWNNIDPAVANNFKKVDSSKFINFGTPYDYMSVMHYPALAGSANGQETMVPKNNFYLNKIGQRRGLSRGDVARINNMYECRN